MRSCSKGGLISVLLATMVQFAVGDILYVSKDGESAYTSIQDAINAAKAGDIIEIRDFEVYEEQVTIDSSKNRLTLRSTNPKLSRKPTVKWQDRVNVGPRNKDEALIESMINYDQNGAVRVMGAKGVTIEGIIMDGNGVYPFAYPAIWEAKYSLFHGNAALTLWVAGDAVVRNCEMRNAYFGINVKDRNEGGIFANANPADIEPWKVVPLSGFGETGNHLIEHNRIHHNSWGIFSESTWDLGSIVRYNLFYENHHPDSLVSRIKGMTDEGDNQPGGALFFKDMLLSPWAIYNNTFWHNFVIFGAHWRGGSQHLIFNNICAQPYVYWADHEIFQNPYHKIDDAFPNRMHHCLYASQMQRPKTRTQKYTSGMMDPGINEYVEKESTVVEIGEVRVMNGLDKIQIEGQDIVLTLPLSSGPVSFVHNAEWVIRPGALLLGGTNTFPASANVRWFEMKFKSTDPADPDFLVPDWDDPDVRRLVVDQGWPEAGIRDADGTIADIGAIPMGGKPETVIMIKPAEPVMIEGTKATVDFDVYRLAGDMSNPRITYIRWIKNIPFQADVFGGSVKPMPASDIVEVQIPATPIKIGSNSLSFSIPARGPDELYAFFELVIEGEDAEGNKVASGVGFLPYRKLDYTFDIEVWNLTQTRQLDTVLAGEQVVLKITPRRVGDNVAFTALVNPVTIKLNSGFDLFSATGEIFALPGGIQNTSTNTVIFTKVPESGTDRVSVSGIFTNAQQGISYGMKGTSDPITILPGPPAKLAFFDPPSQGTGTVNPGLPYHVKIQIYDQFDNKVRQPASVSLQSTAPDIGDVVGSTGGTPVNGMSDTSGMVSFPVGVTNGDLNDTFPLIATLLISTPATDNAKMVVGRAKDRFWIFFSDTVGYDPTAEIRGCSGERFPITIRASTNGDTIITDRNTAFDIDPSIGLAVYASAAESDTVRITGSALVNGEKVIWIKATTSNVVGGIISIYPTEDNSIASATRGGIFFELCKSEISRAAYFADNGHGRVNRVEIYYVKPLTESEIPDSLELYWPNRVAENRKVVTRSQGSFTLNPQDSTHLTVTLDEPFPPYLTYSGTFSQLGSSFWWNPETPDAPTLVSRFSIADSVGPLLMSALLIERIVPEGDDTLYVTFSENINLELIEGETLTLLKNGSPVTLNILNAVPLGDTIRLVVQNAGSNSPAYGDSLKILSTGTIRDQYSNGAHPENRPVPILVSYIPASIDSSWYEDTNADGIVDLVSAKFNKAVHINDLRLVCVWTDGANRTDSLMGADLEFDIFDSTIIKARVAGRFANATHVVNKTSGAMDIIAVYTSFPGVAKSHRVEDRAAPVLTSASYYPGVAINDQVSAPDTLKVTFSEGVYGSGFFNTPHQFFDKATGQGYTLTLDSLTYGVDRYSYLVQPNQVFPNSGDSVNINTITPFFVDAAGNEQDNPANKKVVLKMYPVPYTLEIKAGPNPFNPELAQEVVIQIKPQTKMVESIFLEATITIFDQLGNKVFQMSRSHNDGGSVSQTRGALEFRWNGYNMKGRRVGIGTYLAQIKATDNNPDPAFRSPPVVTKKYIGVTK